MRSQFGVGISQSASTLLVITALAAHLARRGTARRVRQSRISGPYLG